MFIWDKNFFFLIRILEDVQILHLKHPDFGVYLIRLDDEI